MKLYISSVIAKYFKRKPISKNQVIESVYEDGSMDIVVKITNEMEILPIISYWLPNIKVLEPQWLDDRFKQTLERYQKAHYC